MTEHDTVLTLTAAEVPVLTDLITQLQDLVSESESSEDEAIRRLAPDVYPDDAEASTELRRLTEQDLLDRRTADAGVVLAALTSFDVEGRPDGRIDIVLDDETVEAWLRTLAALRLVIATRLGVTSDDDHDPEDPRFGIYDWLGYRLDQLVLAADGE